MSNGDFIPPTDLTTAAIEAVNLILSELGFSPLDVILGLFSGKPKFDDTLAVIGAYNQSAYWPLHALASNLSIAVKNQAPISDSNPAIQAQFGVWKQGTVTSIQSVAGEQPGPNSPGYWTIFALINHSWGASGYGEQAVLQFVKALDAITQVLAQQAQQTGSGGNGGGAGGGGGGGTPNPPPNAFSCNVGNPNQDEIGDLCQTMSFQLSLIYDLLTQIGTQAGNKGIDPCCAAVIQAITSITGQLSIIAQAVLNPPPTGPAIDLTPITAALQALVSATLAYGPTADAAAALLRTGLDNIANALTAGGGTDLSIIDKFVQWVQSEFQMQPGELATWVSDGLVGGDTAQLYSGTIRPPIHNAELLKKLKVFFGDINLFGDWVQTHFKSWLETTLPEWLDWVIANLLKLIKTGMSSNVLSDPQWVQLGRDSLGVFQTLFGPFGRFALDTLSTGVSPPGDIAPADALTNFSTMIGNASSLGAAAFGAATIGGILLGEHSKHLNYFAALFALGAGYDEIAKGLVTALVDPLVATPAKYYYRGLYKAEYPNESNAVEWHSRRLNKGWDLPEIFAVSGLKTKYEQAYVDAAYRPVSPFMIAAGFTNQEVPVATLTDAFQFMGLRDQDITLAINSVEVRALQAVRQAYAQETVTAYADGVVSDQELAQNLTDAGFGKTAASIVTKRALLARRIKLASITESFIVPEVTGGLLTAPEGTQALEAAGVQPWFADLKIQLAETRAALNLNRKQLAAQARLDHERSRSGARAAIAEFRVGNLDTAGLGAALVASQVDPLIATLTTATESAIQQGRLKLVFGQLLDPKAAKVLTDQVAAIEAQYKKQLIDDPTVVAQLKSLNVDQGEATALIARWAAQKVATGKYAEQLPIR